MLSAKIGLLFLHFLNPSRHLLENICTVTHACSQGQNSNRKYTVKKLFDIPVPSRNVTHQTLPGLEYFINDVIIPVQGEFGKFLPAGDGNIEKLFYYVWTM